MTPKGFEKALLALRAYQAAMSDDPLEILCCACVFRNRVHAFGKNYIDILENAEVNRGWPYPTDPVMIHPTEGILVRIDGIYDNTSPDLTANHLRRDGALYFGRVMDHQGTGDDFETEILMKPEEHPLIGTFGAQAFYG
jgi:hypothetical protein